VFLQLHLVLGLLPGPLADRAFDQAKGPALAAVAVLAGGALVFWRARRRNRVPAHGRRRPARLVSAYGHSPSAYQR